MAELSQRKLKEKKLSHFFQEANLSFFSLDVSRTWCRPSEAAVSEKKETATSKGAIFQLKLRRKRSTCDGSARPGDISQSIVHKHLLTIFVHKRL